MNFFICPMKHPYPYLHYPYICMNNKYVTQGELGRSRETRPSVTRWVGQKRPFWAWRIYAMAPSKSLSSIYIGLLDKIGLIDDRWSVTNYWRNAS